MPGFRAAVPLPDSLNQKLNSYALAASAAGVGVLALVPSAPAKIVYTPANVTIKVQQHYNIDLNRDGITDFTLQIKTSQSAGHFYFTTLAAVSPKGNAVEGGKTYSSLGRGNYAFALQRGSRITPRQTFSGAIMALAGTNDGASIYVGQWLDAKNRYLGLKFQIQGKAHYGWARLSVVNTHLTITSAKLTGYAYETVANKAIVAGKTKGKDGITPRPATLGELARGTAVR